MTLLHQAAQKAVEALKRARQFIHNGVEYGYIRMPAADCPDSAHETPHVIFAALKALESALQQQEVPREPVALADEQIIARCKAAGIKWIAPDEQEYGFPGSFDMVTMGEMRALLAASPSTTQQQEAGNDALDARRYRWLQRGVGLTVVIPVPTDEKPDKKVTVIYGPNPEPAYGVSLNAAIDSMLAAAPHTPESAEKDDAGGGKEDIPFGPDIPLPHPDIVAMDRERIAGVPAFHITKESGPAGTSRYRVGPPLNAVYGDEGEARYMIDSYKAVMKTLADRQKRRAMTNGVKEVPDAQP